MHFFLRIHIIFSVRAKSWQFLRYTILLGRNIRPACTFKLTHLMRKYVNLSLCAPEASWGGRGRYRTVAPIIPNLLSWWKEWSDRRLTPGERFSPSQLIRKLEGGGGRNSLDASDKRCHSSAGNRHAIARASRHSLEQTHSDVQILRETWEKFGLHVGNM